MRAPHFHLPRLIQLALPLAMVLAASAIVQAQAVQLPQFGFFTVDTSVLVPDRGTAYLGGVGSSATSSSTSGVPLVGHVPGIGRGFRNRAFGQSTAASGASVTATIIDLNEMEADLMASYAQSHPADAEANAQAAALARAARDTQDAEPLVSVAEIRRQQQEAQASADPEAARHYAAAQAAENEGNYGVARVHYRVALRYAGDELAAEIHARLAALTPASRSMAGN